MARPSESSGVLSGAADVLARLAEAGIRTVGDVLEASRPLRDIADRSNHVLVLGDATWFVKRTKRPRARDPMPREAAALERLRAAGVPTAALAFWGIDPDRGALTGTPALAPARTLDDLLRDGEVEPRMRRRVLRGLAKTVAALHDASLHHKDLYLNHLFVDPEDPAAVVRMIDVERVARHRRALGRWVVKDLAALRHSVPDGTVSEADMTRFLDLYLRARQLPRRGVIGGLARRVRAKARRMARHVPRTPVGEIDRAPPDGE